MLFKIATHYYARNFLADVEDGMETSASDEFLNGWLGEAFHWHALPPGSVQHEWHAGLDHHTAAYIVRLSPETYASLLKAMEKTEAQLSKPAPPTEEPNPAVFQASPMGALSGKHNPDWWNPPSDPAYGIRAPRNADSQYWQVISGSMVYDPKRQLLFLFLTEI